MSKIYIIHENHRWIEPLIKHLDNYELWDFSKGGFLDMSSEPPQGVFYNRMSASSHTRQHRFAAEYTSSVLEWLRLHNRRIINGPRALELEISKVKQYAALEQCGLNVPKTIVSSGKPPNIKDIHDILGKKFIYKHNRSGMGFSVQLCEDTFPEDEPIDGLSLFQEYIENEQNQVLRCEFVGGKHLYTVRISTSEGFDLCPADSCSIVQNFKEKYVIDDEFDHPIISRFQEFLKKNDIEICAIEFIIDKNGDYFVYDVNTNTNYNSRAEKNKYGEPMAMKFIAQFLRDELEKLPI